MQYAPASEGLLWLRCLQRARWGAADGENAFALAGAAFHRTAAGAKCPFTLRLADTKGAKDRSFPAVDTPCLGAAALVKDGGGAFAGATAAGLVVSAATAGGLVEDDGDAFTVIIVAVLVDTGSAFAAATSAVGATELAADFCGAGASSDDPSSIGSSASTCAVAWAATSSSSFCGCGAATTAGAARRVLLVVLPSTFGSTVAWGEELLVHFALVSEPRLQDFWVFDAGAASVCGLAG